MFEKVFTFLWKLFILVLILNGREQKTFLRMCPCEHGQEVLQLSQGKAPSFFRKQSSSTNDLQVTPANCCGNAEKALSWGDHRGTPKQVNTFGFQLVLKAAGATHAMSGHSMTAGANLCLVSDCLGQYFLALSHSMVRSRMALTKVCM